MKRRTFVRLVTAITVVLYLPNLYCKPKYNTLTRMLAQPDALQHICDAKTIHEIGEAYQKQVSNENNKATLVKLLAMDINGNPIDESADSALVASQLAKKIQQDFQQDKTVVVDGWVLSRTEARQCALFSLTEK